MRQSNQLSAIIMASIQDIPDPAMAAKARVLGIDAATIDRMSSIAYHVGPRTVLPNTAVWYAVWQSMIARRARGLAPIPDDDPPVAWATAVWTFLFSASPALFDAPTVFHSLIAALAAARAETP